MIGHHLPVLLLVATASMPPAVATRVRHPPRPIAVRQSSEQDAEARARAAFERGEQALRDGRAAEAAAAFREVLEFVPEDPGIHFRLGQALFMARDAQAIEHLEFARDASGGRPEVAFLLAQAYVTAGRYREAAEALDAVERAAPDVPDVELARGELCYLVGRLDGAERRLRRAVELAPADWGPPLYRLGLTEVARRNWDAAVDWLERAVAADPANVDAWLLLATARNRAGDPTGAVAAMEQAVAADPGNVVARLLLAERYDVTGREDGLMQQVEEVLSRDPENPAALLYRADRAALDGRLDEALVDLDRLLAAPVRHASPLPGTAVVPRATTDSQARIEARRRRIELLSRLGRESEAVADGRRLAADEPGFADGHFVLGNLLMRTGHEDEGRAHLERFKTMSDARVRRSMGDNFLETSDDPALAEAEFEAAVAAWPDDKAAILGLARVRRLQGRPEEALQLLDAARGAARSAETWFREAILSLAQAGRGADALAEWERARQAGVPLGPEVWRVVYSGRYGCD